MKVFSKKKFLERYKDEDISWQTDIWIKECDGKEVINGRCRNLVHQ